MKYATILFMCFVTALANADVGQEVGSMELWVQPTGETLLVNPTDEAIYFDGYEITSYANQLDPSGWIGIEGLLDAGQEAAVIAALGAGAVDFEKAGQASVHNHIMAELNVHGYGVLQAGDRFSLGNLAPDALLDEMRFRYSYVVPGAGGTVYEGDWLASAVMVPEPASISLLIAGCAAVIRRKK